MVLSLYSQSTSTLPREEGKTYGEEEEEEGILYDLFMEREDGMFDGLLVLHHVREVSDGVILGDCCDSFVHKTSEF